MTSIFALLTPLLMFFMPAPDAVVDWIGVRGPVYFNSTAFTLAWSDKPRENYRIQEFLPAGDSVETFHQMMTIHVFITNLTPKEAAQQEAKELDDRKKTDPVCQYSIAASPDGSEAMVDFLLGVSRNDSMKTVEFNVYRYKQITVSENKKAVVVYAYSRRSYGDDITAFLHTLRETRREMLNQMIAAEIPAITLK